MIVRISATIVQQAQSKSFLANLQTTAIPVYEAAPGLLSVSLLQRPFVGYIEILTLSLWVSEETMIRFFHDNPEIDGARSEGNIRIEPRVYEFVLSHRGKLRGADVQQEG